MRYTTVDYHTAGEPFRIVTGGLPGIPGDTVAQRRLAAMAGEADRARRLLVHEPRGHADMYGGFLVPPDPVPPGPLPPGSVLPGSEPPGLEPLDSVPPGLEPLDSVPPGSVPPGSEPPGPLPPGSVPPGGVGADFGVLFWHRDGFSTACGHGTIALGAWAVESGRVAADPDGDTDVRIDVPSGRVTARVRCRGGAVESVAFRNVPSYVLATGLALDTALGLVTVDVSYGGAIYASVPAAAFGLTVTGDRLAELVAAGRAVRQALAGTDVARHPGDDRLSGVYGTILYEELPPTPTGPRQRNVTVFADGQVDRSPCGSGTSARLALLAAVGALTPGGWAAGAAVPADGPHAPVGESGNPCGASDPAEVVLTHESIVGSTFRGRVVAHTEAHGRPAVVTEVEGTAYRTGEHVFTLDPRDPLPTFLLR